MAINILIVGMLRDSLSLCVHVYVDWIRDARTPTRFTFDAHQIARDRERLLASTFVWRVHALEKGQVLRFVSADSVYRSQAYGREQVYGLFQAVCYRRRHIFKASRDRDIAALNFRYAHARANNRTRDTSQRGRVDFWKSLFRRVMKLPKFCAVISFRFDSKINWICLNSKSLNRLLKTKSLDKLCILNKKWCSEKRRMAMIQRDSIKL